MAVGLCEWRRRKAGRRSERRRRGESVLFVAREREDKARVYGLGVLVS